MTAAIDAVSGDRTFYGYDDADRLTFLAPSNSPGTHFAYNEDGTPGDQSSIDSHLGGTRTLLAAPINGTTAGGDADRYAFTITEGELRSSPSGAITIGIEVTSTDFDPAAPTMSGTPAGYEFTETGRSIALFTISQPGTHALHISGGDGNYTATIYLAGDINADRQIDADDSTLFAAAFGSTIGDANYTIAADADRDGDVDAQDRAAVLSTFGFVANRAPDD